ncbi:MAG: ERF family protein [Lachnospiraceae bacterium]|nr:ERF family protein [Lachnospiraceae bacterium]
MKYYNQMNLQQKLCRIRKKIPTLAKRRHTENVDYDYTKIDDIYEYLTPAMDKYGVNFRVIEETPTQKDEHGEPVYLRQKDGMWIYEADALLEWVNIDDPEDTETARIHLIGTHDMAEKAKGTAMTYGIKYYLFSRFNINQGGNAEDSDSVPSPGKKEAVPEPRKLVKRKAGKPEASGEKRPEQQALKETAAGPDPAPSESVAKFAAERSRRAKSEPEKALEVTEKKTEASRPDAAEPSRISAKSPGRQDRKIEPFPAMNPPESRESSSSRKESESPAKALETGNSAEPVKTIKEKQVQADEDTLAEDVRMDQISFGMTADHSFDEFVELQEGEEIPFDEMPEDEKDFDGDEVDMDELEKEFLHELKIENGHGGPMTLERARKIPCAFGPFTGKTFGELFDSGETGRRALEWVVNRYAGNNQEQKEAAAILLKELERQDGLGKAA